MIDRVCENCGQHFGVDSWQLRKGWGKFCSRSCTQLRMGATIRSYHLAKRRPPEIHGDYAVVQVGTDGSMKVSLEDLEEIGSIVWSLETSGYARCKRQRLQAHRLIMERMLGRPLQKRESVDHVDHDPSDNRRSNLRLASASENNMNRKSTRGPIPYKGVRRGSSPGRWRAQIGGSATTGKQLNIGSYGSPEEAAWAYDMWASEIYGEYASLNFNYE